MQCKLSGSHAYQAIIEQRENLAAGWAIHARARLGEIRMVEDVENIGPELRVNSLGDSEILRSGDVCIKESGTGERIASHASNGSGLRPFPRPNDLSICGQLLFIRRHKPAACGRIRKSRIAYSRDPADADIFIRTAILIARRKRQAARGSPTTAQRPAADQDIHASGCIVQESLALPERQVINMRQSERVGAYRAIWTVSK